MLSANYHLSLDSSSHKGGFKDMNSQQLAKQLRRRRYSCAFCDSVRDRFDADAVDSELESLFLEHNKTYHMLER